jgi:DNA invertase Pin-like site-specific DNA recombinase
VKAPVIPGPLAGDTIWYEDPARKQLHRDLVLAGMERARQQGKCIGRPRVRERPDFDQRFVEVVSRIGPEGITRSQAARELGIGYNTLKRLLDAQVISEASTEFG